MYFVSNDKNKAVQSIIMRLHGKLRLIVAGSLMCVTLSKNKMYADR